ncbi:hypothetical protein HDU67_001703, partial [Dinochytrium kinnereticum]
MAKLLPYLSVDIAYKIFHTDKPYNQRKISFSNVFTTAAHRNIVHPLHYLAIDKPHGPLWLRHG